MIILKFNRMIHKHNYCHDSPINQKISPRRCFLFRICVGQSDTYPIDRLTDNVILFFYLLILDGLIVLVNIIERSPEVNLLPLLTKYKQWYPFVIQFLLGGTVQRICCLLFPKCAVHQDGCFLCTVAVPPRYK